MYYVINADDLGLSYSFNEGILESFKNGFLTSASIRTNGYAFRDAIERIIPECRGLGIGVHLNVAEGPCKRKSINKASKICDSNSDYRLTFFNLLIGWLSNDKGLLQEIKADFKDQIETVLAHNIDIDHLDSHNNFHVIPGVFKIVCELAHEYKIPFVRLPRESFYLGEKASYHFKPWYLINLIKYCFYNHFQKRNLKIAGELQIKVSNYFISVLYSNYMNRETTINGIKRIQMRRPSNNSIVEVMIHPCKIVASKKECYVFPPDRDYVINLARRSELNALLDYDLFKNIEAMNGKLASYGELANLGRANADRNKNSPKRSMQLITIPKKLNVFVVAGGDDFSFPRYIQGVIDGSSIIKVCGAAVIQSSDLKKTEGDLRKVFKKHGIPYAFINQKDKKLAEYVKTFNPDVILLAGSILPDKLVAAPKIGCISALPSFREQKQLIFKAIQSGDKFISASIYYYLNEPKREVLLVKKHIPIFKNDSVSHLCELYFIVSLEATLDAFLRLNNISISEPFAGVGIGGRFDD